MGRFMKKLPSFRGALVLSSAMALAFAADAGTRSYSHISPDTQAEISIRTPGQSAVSRSVVLPFSKSTVVELPVGMKDVIISNPDIVEAMVHTDKRAVLIGKRPGQTNAYFYGHNGEEILNLEIRVERDISGLRELFAQHAPEANVQVQAVNDNLLLTGSVPNAAAANRVESLAEMWLDESTGSESDAEVINLMSIEGKDQVLLKVRIVEMQRSITKQLGINLSAIGQLGDHLKRAVFPPIFWVCVFAGPILSWNFPQAEALSSRASSVRRAAKL